MSTYTDLKNRVKETITVGFRPEDRVTTQKVRFYNEENEYWGSFSGSLSGKVDIFKGNLSSVDVYDATLVNPVIKTSTGLIIDLGSIADQLEELSVYAHEDLSGAFWQCIKSIADVSGAISAVSGDTVCQLSGLSSLLQALSSAFDGEVSARISSDERIESDFAQRIIELAQTAAAADKRLYKGIAALSGELSDEVSARTLADEAVSASLTSYADRRRHYEIYSMDAGPQMPIKAKEFAVNRLVNYDLPDGFVVDDRNQLVGSVEGYDAATGDCRFVAYSDANYSAADESGVKDFPYARILGLNSYNFDAGTQARQCQDAVHELVYVRAAAPGDFEQNQFDIRMMMPNMRTVKRNGRTIGYVYGAGTEPSVSAGTLQFIPSELADDPNLSSFANDTQVPFSAAVNGGKISDDALYPNCDLQIISAMPMFHYRAQISSWPLKLLGGGFESCRARVYRDLLDKEEGELVRRFAVSMVAKHDTAAGQQDFYLDAPGFESTLREYGDKSRDLLRYDDVNKVISYENEKKYLSCLVRVIDSGKQFDLPLSSLDANTGLISASSAAISFAPLSGAVNDAIRPLVVAGPYALARVGGVLSCEISTRISGDEDGGDVVIRLYDTGAVFARFRSADGNVAVFGDDDYVDFEQQGVCDDQSAVYGRCEFDADAVDFEQDPPDERCAEEGDFWIGAAAGEGDEYTGLQFRREYQKTGRQAYGVNDIVIEIPDKAEGSAESREFLFVIRPQGSGAPGQKAAIKFVTPRGDPIEFFAEHLPEFRIDCGKYITFRLQEITYGKFALLDWDQSVQESRLDYLESALKSEVSGRISVVSGLSAALSGEIDSLSAALSGEIDSLSGNVFKELSAHDSRISANRKDIDFLFEVDRKNMVYNGTLLSVDTETDRRLSCYFQHALGHEQPDPAFMFKTGFTYRLSAEQTGLVGSDGVSVSLYPKDIITFNRDARLSSVCAGDFDVVNDYNAEIYGVSVSLCAEIQNLSASLCAEIQNLSASLSGEIDSLSAKLSGEIDSLSAGLSGEIDDLSAELIGLINSTSAEITGTVSAVSSDLSAAIDAKFTLSVDFSELSGEVHELSGFMEQTLLSAGEDKPGLMKLQDEYHYEGEGGLRNYEMRMISGTIKLVRMA